MAKFVEQNDIMNELSLLDLADMPERPTLPTGSYAGTWVDITTKMREAEGDKPEMLVAVIKLQFGGAVELSKPEEAEELERIKDGAEIEYNFFLNNEYGQGSLKKVLQSVATELELPADAKFAQIREAMQDRPVTFQVSRRPAKNPTESIKWDINLVSVTTASPTEVAAG